MSPLSSYLLLAFLLGPVAAQIFGARPLQPQRPPQSQRQVCPPALPVDVCYASCLSDSQCQGFHKCCPTACGGTICSRPVTGPAISKLKDGVCPSTPTGPWVCSHTCTGDDDCRGRTKCCRNRCGAFTCMLPEKFTNGNNVYQ